MALMHGAPALGCNRGAAVAFGAQTAAPAPLQRGGVLGARASAARLAAAPARRGAAARRVRNFSVRAAGAPGEDVPPGYGDTFPPPKPLRRAGVLLHPTSLPVRFSRGLALLRRGAQSAPWRSARTLALRRKDEHELGARSCAALPRFGR
jgi:hypothetical protein